MPRVKESVQAVAVSKTKTIAVKAVVKQDAASHPPYLEMAKAAISDLKERTGSSRQAILKYITGTYGIAEDKKVVAHLRKALVNGVASGDLNQASGTGANGSFKLNKDKNGATKKKTDDAPKKSDAAPKKTVAPPKKTVAPSTKAVEASKKKSEPVAAASKKTANVKTAATSAAKPKPQKSNSGTMKKTTSDEKKPAPVKKTTSAEKKTAPVKKTASTRSRAAK